MNKFCPNCGQPVADGTSFCPYCGSKFDESEVHDRNASPVSPKQTQQQKSSVLGLIGVVLSAIAIILLLMFGSDGIAFYAVGGVLCGVCGIIEAKKYDKKMNLAITALVMAAVCLVGSAFIGQRPEPQPKTEQPSIVQSTPEATEPEKEIVYTQYEFSELLDDLSNNALAAERKHKDEYVEIIGYLTVIDSDGKYIAIGAKEDDWDYLFEDIHCDLTSEEQKDIVASLTRYQGITVRGHITDIGEMLGYVVKVDEIIPIKKF